MTERAKNVMFHVKQTCLWFVTGTTVFWIGWVAGTLNVRPAHCPPCVCRCEIFDAGK